MLFSNKYEKVSYGKSFYDKIIDNVVLGVTLTQNDYITTLKEFGLTALQAKIYLILLQVGRCTVKEIAQPADLARQEIYRVIPTILKLGLAKKVVSKPLQYEATPLESGLMILLQRQKEKVGKLELQKRWLVNNIHTNNTDLKEEDPQLTIINEIELWFNTYKKLIQRTEHTLDITLPVLDNPQRFHLLWIDAEENLTAKKLKIRLITQLPVGSNQPPKSILSHNLFETKYLKEPVPFGMHIYDRREFTMSISQKSGLPSLWSNNPNMVKLAQDHFDLLWSKAEAE